MSGSSSKAQRRAKGRGSGTDWSALDIRMLRDDAAWIYSVAMATVRSDWQAATGLGVGTQMARVLHEGVQLLGRQRPAQAKHIRLELEKEIAAARHSVKLLDDNKKLYEGVVGDFERIGAEHRRRFAQGGDLAVASNDGRIFSTSRVASFQQIASISDRGSISGRNTYSSSFSNEIGRALVTLLKNFGYGFPTPTPLSVPDGPAPRFETSNHERFCETHYGRHLSGSLKDVVAIVESSINASVFVFEPSADAFHGPVFRARFVAAAHALNAFHEIAERHPSLAGDGGFEAIMRVVNSPRAQRLRSLRALRNRSMHYGVPGSLKGLGAALPAYGLVEATTDGLGYDEVNSDTRTVLIELSDALRNWRPLVNDPRPSHSQ